MVIIRCQSNLESMLKEFQTRYELPATGKVDPKVLELMKKPRCDVKAYTRFTAVNNSH